MALNEKEKTTIKDLQTQEQTCIKKYKKYGQDAKDPVLKDLFSTLEKNEQKHYNTLVLYSPDTSFSEPILSVAKNASLSLSSDLLITS